MNKKVKIVLIAAAVIILAEVVTISALLVVKHNAENSYAQHLELAQKYLEDGDYEEAIAEFEAAIEIQPKQTDAYTGLADAYIAMGDYEAAVDILNEGYEATGERTVRRKLKSTQELMAEAVSVAETAETEAVEAVSAEASSNEYYYAAATTLTKNEVEEYAGNVRNLFIQHKWSNLAGMIDFPITIDGITYDSIASFVQGDLDDIYSEDFMSALEAEDCVDMYCTSDGIALGNSNVVIAEVEKNGASALKIVGVNGLIDWGKEEVDFTECDALVALLDAMVENFFDFDYNYRNYSSYSEAMDKSMTAVTSEDWGELLEIAVTGYLYSVLDMGKSANDVFSQEVMQEKYYENGYWALTYEEVEMLAASVTGTEWDVDSLKNMGMVMSGAENWAEIFGGYVVFGGFGAGDTDSYYTENLSSTYIGDGKWQITAEVWYGVDFDDKYSYIVGELNVTVFRNSESLFDGYSIEDAYLIEADMGWVEAYYDYFVNWEENREDIDEDFFVSDGFSLVYVDDDNIPEIYVSTDMASMVSRLWVYNGDEVTEGTGYCSYIPRTGLLFSEYGREGYSFESVELLADGETTRLGYGEQDIKDGKYDEWMSYYGDEDADYYNYFFDFTWNDESVTYEEYEANLNAIYDETKSQGLYDSNVIGDGSLDDLLNFLLYYVD